VVGDEHGDVLHDGGYEVVPVLLEEMLHDGEDDDPLEAEEIYKVLGKDEGVIEKKLIQDAKDAFEQDALLHERVDEVGSLANTIGARRKRLFIILSCVALYYLIESLSGINNNCDVVVAWIMMLIVLSYAFEVMERLECDSGHVDKAPEEKAEDDIMDVGIAAQLDTCTPPDARGMVELTEARHLEIIALWRTNLLNSFALLFHRATVEAREVGDRGNLSLVLYTEGMQMHPDKAVASGSAAPARTNVRVINFISWQDQDPKTNSGQPIFIDLATHKVKFSMFTTHPYRVLKDPEIIISDCDVAAPKRQSLHMAKTVRPSINNKYIELKALYERALRNLGPDKMSDIEQCIACGHGLKPRAEGTAASSSAHPSERTFQCAMCRLVWHTSCSELFRATVSKCKDMAVPRLPPLFSNSPTDIACCLCRRQM